MLDPSVNRTSVAEKSEACLDNTGDLRNSENNCGGARAVCLTELTEPLAKLSPVVDD